ncbi:MAG: glycosyltransferase family 87 protein [Pseudomonadota bacterium]
MNHFSATVPSIGDTTNAIRRLIFVLGAMIALTAANLLFHQLHLGPDLFKGRICEDGYGFFPGPLFHSWDRFMDYFNMQHFQPARGEMSALPPTLILLYQIAERLTSATSPATSVFIFSLFQITVFASSVCRLLSSPGGVPGLDFSTRLTLAVAITVCSYPVYFAIDRGNFALTLCALLNFAIDAHLRDKRWRAGILIGLAAALRITPLVFAAIYLSRRDFRYLLAAVVTAMLASAVSITVTGVLLEGYTLESWLNGFDGHSYMYTTWTNGLGWSSSLYNLVRFIRYLDGIPLDAILDSAYRAEKIYSVVCAGLLGLMAWKIRRTNAITGFTLLSLAFVALPHVTGDYYLAALIAPMVMIAGQSRIDYLSLILLILLLVPKDYFYFYVKIHKLTDIKVHDFAHYRELLGSGQKPSSIQALLINPLLLFWLGVRMFLRRPEGHP